MSIWILACSTDPDVEDTSPAATGTDDTSSTQTGSGRTLENCTTSIPDDAPDFFGTYFRCVTASVGDVDVALLFDDLPPHASPYYDPDDPNWVEFDDRGGDWFQNPNQLTAQAITVLVPVDPTPRGLTITADLVDEQAGTSDDEYRQMGAALDGTAMFHGVAAPGDVLADEQYTFDLYEGHPQNTGVYHHHGPTPASLAVLDAAGLGDVELYGVMCDGTFVLGCTELDATSPNTDDVDAQRGHVHDLVDADGVVHFAERYHTHLCAALDDYVYAPEIQYYEDCPEV